MRPRLAPYFSLALLSGTLCFATAHSTEKNSPSSSKVIIKNTKGVALICNKSELKQPGISDIEGVVSYGVDVPGGLNGLARKIEPLFLNKPLSKEQIKCIQTEIIKYYKACDLPVVAVYVPQQKISDGVLKLVVTVAKVGEVKVSGNHWTREKEVLNTVKFRAGEVIKQSKLVNQLSHLNRNPFRSVSALYTPGEDVGTTDIELVVQEKSPFRVYGGADHTGLSRTGHLRLFAGAQAGNLWNRGHLASYQYTTSDDFSDFQSHTGSYSIPLPRNHTLTAFGGYSHVKSIIQKNRPQTKGDSYQFSLRYEMPLPMMHNLSHRFRFGGDYKKTDNTLEFSPTQVGPKQRSRVALSQLMTGYSVAGEHNFFKVGLDLDIYYSPGDYFNYQTNSHFRNLRAKAENKYIYGRANGFLSLAYKGDGRFVTSFKAQKANANLLPSEQLGLGGMHSIRGYDERQQNVDSGWISTTEVFLPSFPFIKNTKVIKWNDKLTLLGFCDFGKGKQHRETKFLKDAHLMMAVGPALRYTIGGNITVNADWGYRLRRNHFGDGKSRIHFSAIASY